MLPTSRYVVKPGADAGSPHKAPAKIVDNWPGLAEKVTRTR
ncbi:hypothetical protein [Streptomyces sp.]|nr:hypothetical protein [Streptomyces sp.]HET6359426.1 hypothetical protein [Streptomyces sp.]